MVPALKHLLRGMPGSHCAARQRRPRPARPAALPHTPRGGACGRPLLTHVNHNCHGCADLVYTAFIVALSVAFQRPGRPDMANWLTILDIVGRWACYRCVHWQP